jgi:hypothetical protein
MAADINLQGKSETEVQISYMYLVPSALYAIVVDEWPGAS